MPRVGRKRYDETDADKTLKRPVMLPGHGAVLAAGSVDVSAGSADLDLGTLIRKQFPGGVNNMARDWYKEDPVVWVKEKKPIIETKDKGLVVFDPWPFQEALLRHVWSRDAVVIEKARQLGVSTSIMVGVTHQFLYGHEVTGVPCHFHIIANTEDTAKDRLLKIAKTVLWYLDLEDELREALTGYSPDYGNIEIRYNGPRSQNYIRAHTTSGDAGRSFAGNGVLLEEAAIHDKLRDIWTSIQPMVLDLAGAGLGSNTFVVSTHKGSENFFCELVDRAEEKGLVHIPLPWNVHPQRDAEWERQSRQAFEGSQAEWEQEFALRRIKAGEQALDIETLRAHAARWPWIGPDPLVGHKYLKGVDTSGPGKDSETHCAIDLSLRPAQVVWQRSYPKGSTDEKVARIERLDQTYPGPLYIDGTNDPTLPGLIRSRNVVAVRFTGGATENEKIDDNDRLRWRMMPRTTMRSRLVGALEQGDLLVHEEEFPALWRALQTAVIGYEKEGGKIKRKGKNVDDFDSLMLASLGLPRRVRGEIKRKSTGHWKGLASSDQLRELRRQRW